MQTKGIVAAGTGIALVLAGMGSAMAAQPTNASTSLLNLLAKDANVSVAQVQTVLAKDGHNLKLVAQDLGINMTTLRQQLQALHPNARMRGGFMIRVLAKAANVPVSQVLADLKAQNGNIQAVAKALGVNLTTLRQQMRAAHPGGFARSGFMAQAIATDANVPLSQVRALKTRGVTWQQVAAKLNVNWTTLTSQLKANLANHPHGQWPGTFGGSGTTPPTPASN